MFTIYAKPDCPFCHYAEELLKVLGRPYTKLMLGADFNKDDLDTLVPGFKTYPQIIYILDGTQLYIGGYTDLVAHTKESE